MFDEDLIEIVEAQVDRLSENEELTIGEARFTARERTRRVANRFADEDADLFDDPEYL